MKPLKVYACYNVDNDVRLSSSSGAVFSALAEYVFDMQGVVYGVSMSEDCYSAEFIAITDSAGLTKLRGSKYLQAKVGNVFKQIKEELIAGKVVLFSGTGCQVSGLKRFLGRDYEKLICIDVICHGTPSPTLWKKYAQYQEQQNGGKLKSINFRCKDDKWIDLGMKEVIKLIPQEQEKRLYISKDKNSYMKMFLKDYSLRPSCYKCVSKTVKMSDITIADFWGIDNVAPEMNDGKGTSLVLIRTDKGKEIFERISRKMKLQEVSYEDGVKENPAEYKSCTRPLQRNEFFTDMHNMSFEELERKYVPPVKVSFESKVKRVVKKVIRKSMQIFVGRVTKCNEEYGLLFIFHV